MAQSFTDLQLSRSKRRGIIALISLLILLLILWRLLPAWLRPGPDAESRQLQLAWQQFKQEHMVSQASDEKYTAAEAEPLKAAEDKPGLLFAFDPNTATEQELIRLGLPAGTAKTLVKYRGKGGKFYKKEDLRRLYTLKPADYERIAPYVRIAGTAGQPPAAYGQHRQSEATAYNAVREKTELNGADVQSLVRLKGIGPVFAQRILNYRNALGGFVSVEQLREVYGLPDSVYRQLEPLCTVDRKQLQLINVNAATEETLARHPYIRKGLASGIIKLRKDLKSFTEIVQIRQVPLINEEKYRKIAPYLSTH